MRSKVKVNFLKRNCFSSLYFVLSTVFFCQQYRSISYDLHKLLCIFCYTCIFSFAQHVKLSTLFG